MSWMVDFLVQSKYKCKKLSELRAKNAKRERKMEIALDTPIHYNFLPWAKFCRYEIMR